MLSLSISIYVRDQLSAKVRPIKQSIVSRPYQKQYCIHKETRALNIFVDQGRRFIDLVSGLFI